MGAGTVVSNPHPLMQPEKLGRILTDIATNAAPTAIVELIRWLDSFHFESEVPLPELARLVATLDEAAQPQLRQAASLGRAYDLVLGGLAVDFSIEPSDKLRTEVLLRTVRAAAGEMKWVAFDYQELSPEVWQRAVSAYRVAHLAGGLNSPVNVREGRETRTTINREFIRLVAMQCASLDQLSPDRIEAADKLVRYLQHSLALSLEPRNGSQFSIDLETSAAPQRCLSVLEDAPASTRYFRPGDVVPMLGELRQTLAEGNLGPVFAGIGASSVTGAIRHLSRQWGPVPPMRQYRRHAVQGELALATGLGFIRTLISGDALIRPAAAWTLCDASRSGFGVASPVMDPEICRVGVLVGAHLGEVGRWVLALRRVRSSEQGGATVGLQTVSSEPVPVLLDDGSRSWSGILCDPVVRGRGVRIACEPGAMRSTRPVFAKLGGRMVKLQPGRAVVSGPGYQIVECTLL